MRISSRSSKTTRGSGGGRLTLSARGGSLERLDGDGDFPAVFIRRVRGVLGVFIANCG
jgi:hypothetical protein